MFTQCLSGSLLNGTETTRICFIMLMGAVRVELGMAVCILNTFLQVNILVALKHLPIGVLVYLEPWTAMKLHVPVMVFLVL